MTRERDFISLYKKIPWFSVGRKVWIVDGNHGHLHGATVLGDPFKIPNEDYLEDKEKKKVLQEIKAKGDFVTTFDPDAMIDGGISVVFVQWIECGRKDIVECERLSGPIFVENDMGRTTRRGKIMPRSSKKASNKRKRKEENHYEHVSPKSGYQVNNNDDLESSVTMSDSDSCSYVTAPQNLHEQTDGFYIKKVLVTLITSTDDENETSSGSSKDSFEVFKTEDTNDGIFVVRKMKPDSPKKTLPKIKIEIKKETQKTKEKEQKHKVKHESVISRVRKKLSLYGVKKIALARLERRHRRLSTPKSNRQNRAIESSILSRKSQFNASIKPHEVLMLAKHPNFDFGDSDMSD